MFGFFVSDFQPPYNIRLLFRIRSHTGKNGENLLHLQQPNHQQKGTCSHKHMVIFVCALPGALLLLLFTFSVYIHVFFSGIIFLNTLINILLCTYDSVHYDTCICCHQSIFNFTSLQTVTDWKLSLVVLFVAGFGILLTILQVSVPELRPTPDLRINDERGNNTVNVCDLAILLCVV